MYVVLNITETWSVLLAAELGRCVGAVGFEGCAEVGKAGLACSINSN